MLLALCCSRPLRTSRRRRSPNRGAKTREISTGELREILEGRTATVLDARLRAEYAVSHISGAQRQRQARAAREFQEAAR